VTVGTATYAVNDDGIIDCPEEKVSHVADVLADVYDRDAADLLTNKSGESAESLVKDGVCPWCPEGDRYEGDNVGVHASQAHPEAWQEYKSDT
jgi:hypothetical protein